MSAGTEVRHTPGPWRTDPELGYESVLGPDGVLVADCAIFGFGIDRPQETNRANARLIATVLDLLDAVRELAAVTERALAGDYDEMDTRDALDDARAAIQKATGGTP